MIPPPAGDVASMEFIKQYVLEFIVAWQRRLALSLVENASETRLFACGEQRQVVG